LVVKHALWVGAKSKKFSYRCRAVMTSWLVMNFTLDSLRKSFGDVSLIVTSLRP